MLERPKATLRAITSRVILRNLLLILVIATVFFLSHKGGTATLVSVSCTPAGCSDFDIDGYAEVSAYGVCGEDDPSPDGYCYAYVYGSCDDWLEPTYDEAYVDIGVEAFVCRADAYFERHTIAWNVEMFSCQYGDGGGWDDEYGCDYWYL